MFLQALYCAVCVILLWKICDQYIRRPCGRTPPQLSRKLPFLGHFMRFYGDGLHFFTALEELASECTQKGGVISLSLGPHHMNAITDPEDCLKISNECLEKDHIYDFAKPFLGSGLTIAKLPRWKKHRGLLNPSFRITFLNSFISVFNSQARKLTRQFAAHLNKGYFDHEPYLQSYSLESICITSYGINIEDTSSELYRKFLDGTNEILEIFNERYVKVWLHSDFVYNMTKLKKRQDQVKKNIMEFTNCIMQKRKIQLLSVPKIEDMVLKSDSDFKPFLDVLIQLSKDECLTDEDIIFETNNIIGGGYDTSSLALTNVLSILGEYPDVQNKAFDEIRQVLGSSDRDIDKYDLTKLVYLEAVLKETLRLYPVGPVISRYVDKDVQLKNYLLKKGSICILLLNGVLKHPVWGPDADQFRPERWFEPLPKYAFAAFGLGRRACIGKRYALMSIKTTLAHLLRQFKITRDDTKMTFKMATLARPHSGYYISLQNRDKSNN